ncbi:MAG: hypothetical protein EBR10_04810 [Planctomycetes bacterium]|nr:hypothetical protein [Planctomycetota bacterium]
MGVVQDCAVHGKMHRMDGMRSSEDALRARRTLGRVREVDWLAIVPSLRILGAVPAGLRPVRLVLAFVLLLTVVAAGRVWDGFAQPTAPPEGLLAGPMREAALVSDLEAVRSVIVPELPAAMRAAAATATLEELAEMLVDAQGALGADAGGAARFASQMSMIAAARPRLPFEALHEAVRGETYRTAAAVLQFKVGDAVRGLRALAVDIPAASWSAAPAFSSFFVLVCVVVFGWGGGLLCRLSAGDLASHAWTLTDAGSFIRPRVTSLIFAPIFAAVLVGTLLLPSLLFGWLASVPLVNIVAAALMPLALLCAMLAAVVAAAALIGAVLLAPAVACDGCDAVESIQRAGAYILARPLHLLWSAVLSAVAMSLGLLAVDFVVAFSWGASMASMQAGGAAELARGAGAMRFLEPLTEGPSVSHGFTDGIAAALIDIWRTVLGVAIGATVLSVGFACATRTYALLRASADGQEWSDMWIDGEPTGAPTAAPTGSRGGAEEISANPTRP